ncbi:MAG: hypothetical protein MSH22_06300 [Spirochaetia bacterium]|nr:hypothetical protein [Spirochaetia bacterium]
MNESIAKDIEKLLQYFFNTCFINIVEEPEQNLYPQSQNKVLYELLECKNNSEENKLLVKRTTIARPNFFSFFSYNLQKKGKLQHKLVNKSISSQIYSG